MEAVMPKRVQPIAQGFAREAGGVSVLSPVAAAPPVQAQPIAQGFASEADGVSAAGRVQSNRIPPVGRPG